MRILIACEYSGIVRDAFKEKGHDVWSCDILPTESPGQHIQGDVLKAVNWVGFQQGCYIEPYWDMMIAFPPCTHLAVSGARYFPEKRKDGRQQKAIDFFMALINAPIEKICVENPVSIMSTIYRKPDQIIQPWQFMEIYNKKTCLWLKNLPVLLPISNINPKYNWCSSSYRSGSRKKSPLKSLHRNQKMRSRFFPGIAAAMASQWSTI